MRVTYSAADLDHLASLDLRLLGWRAIRVEDEDGEARYVLTRPTARPAYDLARAAAKLTDKRRAESGLV